jgi:uncharacterized protein YbjT (DUF2867 family)
MKRVLVAGATGYLGRYATRAFKEHGYWVRALVRSPEKLSRPGRFLDPVVADYVDDVFVGDVTRPVSLRGCGDGIDVVFSSVGITRPTNKATFREVDYQGNVNLLNEVRRGQPEAFIYVSVFNAHRYERLAIIKAHEDFVRTLRVSSMSSAIMRPTGYFSDMCEFLRMAKNGRVFLIGPGHNRLNPIHGADLARECVKAVGETDSEVPVGGPQTLSQQEIAELAFDVLGRSPRITHLPPVLLKGVVKLLRPFNRQLADLGDFFVTAGTAEGVAPPVGHHTLRDYFAQLTEHWKKA